MSEKADVYQKEKNVRGVYIYLCVYRKRVSWKPGRFIGRPHITEQTVTSDAWGGR